MAQPSREEAVRTLEDDRAELLEVLAKLSDEERARVGTIGGGDWSAKDLLGHLSFWEQLALEALQDRRAGRRPRVEEIFGERGAVDAANAEDVERKRPLSWEEVRALSDDGHRRLVEEIRAMSDDEWRAKAPYPTERRNRLASLLGAVLGSPDGPFTHTRAHLPDLHGYVESLGETR